MNYQKELDILLEALPNHKKTLLLHSCCAPCSSYVLEYLKEYFAITVFYYNPNISEPEEYSKRSAEQKRLITAMNRALGDGENPIYFMQGKYQPEFFQQTVSGLENCLEGGERCERCFRMRLSETAKTAKVNGFDYFTTTLSISPLKDAELLNLIGIQLAKQMELIFLPADFKKKNGYRRSTELSREYGLYRQDYCGCIYSKIQREQEKRNVRK